MRDSKDRTIEQEASDSLAMLEMAIELTKALFPHKALSRYSVTIDSDKNELDVRLSVRRHHLFYCLTAEECNQTFEGIPEAARFIASHLVQSLELIP